MADHSSSSGRTTRADAESTAPRRPGGEVADPGRVGRFIVLRKLGEGGMGVVYAAYDEELERKVAIKVLRSEFHGAQQSVGQARLAREAQAMARLSHPNVAQIYEVGRHEGAVFIAMEFVSGGTLREWLQREERPWRAVLAAYLQAGAGLAAAHAAGIVHRDFKPDNVLLGDDQRVRVVDFGLARPGEPTAEETLAAMSGSRPSELTQVGTFIGTPAYMAPEQLRREPADEQSDQFSFCVALFEGLYGFRPFRGDDSDAVAEAVLHGRPTDPPRDSEVPGWIHQVLLRGLERVPAARHQGMAALLAALSADPQAARRRRLGIAGVVVAAAAAAAGGSYALAELRGDGAAVCGGAPARLAEVWSPGVASRVRAAFARAGVGYADEVAARVEPRIQAYADAWTAMHRDACEVHRRGEQSDALYDLRMACLDDRHAALQALTTVLAAADAEVVEHALQATDRLPSLARCADARALLAQRPPPDDPELARATQALRARLATAQARHDVGQYRDAQAEVQALRVDAEATGHAGTQAATLYLEGRVQDALGEYAAAEATLVRAVTAADAAADDDLRALAQTELVRVIGLHQARFDEGLRHAALVDGTVQRLADGRPVAAALAQRLAELQLRRGALVPAVQEVDRAVELHAQLYGEASAQYAKALEARGALHFVRSEYAQAKAVYGRVAAIYEEVYGPRHPILGNVLNNLGAAQLSELDWPAAEATYTRVLELLRGAYEPDHPSLGIVHTNLGMITLYQGRHAEAIAELRRALAIHEARLQPDHPTIGQCLAELAGAYLLAGQFAEAEATYARALAIDLKAFGPGHARTTRDLADLARAQLARGDAEAAERSFQRALAEFTGPPDDPARGPPLAGLGELQLAAADPAAKATLGQALELLQRLAGAPQFEVAAVQFALARALGRADPRAQALADAARATYLRVGAAFAGDAAAVDAWLASSPAGAARSP